MSKITVATLSNIVDRQQRLLAEMADRIHMLENIMIGKQIATTKTLGRVDYNLCWLTEIGVNPEALETTNGREMVEALQICREGQWDKLRFTSAYYKAHTNRCQALLKRVGDLAREQSRGSKQTKRTKQNPVTWLLVAVNPQEGVGGSQVDNDEPTF